MLLKAIAFCHLLTLLAPLVAALPEYYQCGGSGWTGGTTCDPGLSCVPINEDYSHCLRPTGTGPPSPAVTSLMNRTALASFYYRNETGAHVRVYYQDIAHLLRYAEFDQQTGWHLPDNNRLTAARDRTPLAVTSWSNGTEIRLYYLDDNSFIKELAYTNNAWQSLGLIDERFRTTPNSKLSAISSTDKFGAWIRVYYQDLSSQLREAAWDPTAGSWTMGAGSLPYAYPGTSISAVTSPYEQAQNATVLFYQADDNSIRDVQFRNRAWQPGNFQNTIAAAAGSAISATFTASGQYKVLTNDQYHSIVVTRSVIDPDNIHSPTPSTWYESEILSYLDYTLTNSSVSAVALEESGKVKLFYQPSFVAPGSCPDPSFQCSIEEAVEYDGVNWADVRLIHPM